MWTYRGRHARSIRRTTGHNYNWTVDVSRLTIDTSNTQAVLQRDTSMWRHISGGRKTLRVFTTPPTFNDNIGESGLREAILEEIDLYVSNRQ